MAPTKDTSRADAAADDEVARLKKEVDELKIILGRATARIQKLETELETSRAQVAWLHRQLFGQKAERSPENLESAWLTFVKEQEGKARGLATPVIDAELSSIQLLLGFLDPTAPPADVRRPEAPPPTTGSAEAPGAPAPKPKKRGHGRSKIPPNVHVEPIILEPGPDEIPSGARLLSVELSSRIGIQPARVTYFAVVRPQYAIDREDGTTRVITAPPPDEMIPRGLFAPSGLAHIIASKWDRHVPYNRLASSFAAEDFRLSPSTLSGVAIRAAPLAGTLVEAMELHAKEVAPYLSIDATGALLQRKKACLQTVVAGRIPIVEQLLEWRDDLLRQSSLPPRGLLAKALRYLRNQADRLSYFLADGAVPIHNNAAELQLRHFAVGRKNWLFYGSEAGADAGSIWLSLVLSARMHRLPVERYLRDLFRVLPSWPKHRVLELAPHRWRATRARLDPLELEQELGPITIPTLLEG